MYFFISTQSQIFRTVPWDKFFVSASNSLLLLYINKYYLPRGCSVAARCLLGRLLLSDLFTTLSSLLFSLLTLILIHRNVIDYDHILIIVIIKIQISPEILLTPVMTACDTFNYFPMQDYPENKFVMSTLNPLYVNKNSLKQYIYKYNVS